MVWNTKHFCTTMVQQWIFSQLTKRPRVWGGPRCGHSASHLLNGSARPPPPHSLFCKGGLPKSLNCFLLPQASSSMSCFLSLLSTRLLSPFVVRLLSVTFSPSSCLSFFQWVNLLSPQVPASAAVFSSLPLPERQEPRVPTQASL